MKRRTFLKGITGILSFGFPNLNLLKKITKKPKWVYVGVPNYIAHRVEGLLVQEQKWDIFCQSKGCYGAVQKVLAQSIWLKQPKQLPDWMRLLPI